MIERITPLLLLQAHRHLPRTLVRLYDPEEVVQEVGTRAFPRLGEFQSATVSRRAPCASPTTAFCEDCARPFPTASRTS